MLLSGPFQRTNLCLLSLHQLASQTLIFQKQGTHREVMEKGKGLIPRPRQNCPGDLRGVGAGNGAASAAPAKSRLLPAGRRGKPRFRSKGELLTRNPRNPQFPARHNGAGEGGRAGPRPLPPPLPPAQRLPLPGRTGREATGAAPCAPNSPGLPTRPGSAPPPRLSRSGGAWAGRGEGGRERRGGEPPPGSGTEAAGPGSGRRGAPRGAGQPGEGSAAAPGPQPAGRAAAVPHHVGVLQASPLLLRLRSEWTAAAAAALLTGSPGSCSCAVRGGPGAARGGSPGPRGGGGTGADAGLPARGFPGARGSPGGRGAGERRRRGPRARAPSVPRTGGAGAPHLRFLRGSFRRRTLAGVHAGSEGTGGGQ